MTIPRIPCRFGLLKISLRVAGGLLANALAAQVLPDYQYALLNQQYALLNQVTAPAGYVATVAPQELSEIRGELDPATLADADAFRAAHGAGWRFYVDRRSGAMALAEGPGVAWIPGAGNRLDLQAERGSGPGGIFTAGDLERRARALMARYPNLFKVPASQLVLETRGTLNFGEDGQLWSVSFRQVAGGVPVEDARVVFRLSHGNLVQFGSDRTLTGLPQVKAIAPALTRAQARGVLDRRIGGLRSDDALLEDGALRWVARGRGDTVGYTGPVGAGWDAELVYRFTFRRPGQAVEWQGLVNADTGRVTRFIDANAYASLARASVYATTNCADPNNCVAGTVNEVAVTLPFAKLTFTGGAPCAGNGCYTNSAGAFAYPAGATAAATSLDGKYIKIADACGAIAASATAPGDIDLGTSPDNLAHTNSDCQSATRQSPPGTGPVAGGSGDTHSARNCFYHLNLMNQKARFYLPANQWLQGVDGNGGTGSAVLTATDSAPACNAFWQGGTGSLNFQQKTAALFCNNTGELPDVFLHEFGHGLDQNDATGTAPEGGTGEAMGDSFALLQGQHSCVGTGFRLQDPTDVTWGNKAGYGNNTAGSASQTCSGVRDLDYTRFCAHDAAGCLSGAALAARDADLVQGSHSGPAPDLSLPDAGTPAKYSTMDQTATPAADGKSNFYNCGGPETGGCAGPLNHGCHCESEIASQANWDLAKTLIKTEFGGDIYAAPQGPKEVSGWQYMDRLWYLTRDLAVSAYQAAAGITNGCGVNSWFSNYRVVDDDNGNLNDGTPHAAGIFSAFKLHEIACGAASDASNLSSGCPAVVAAPVLRACDNKAPVQIAWNAVSGATQYRILRNTLGCQYGFTPLAVRSAAQLFFEDTEVAPGNTYYYSVQPVGAGNSCYGQTSNCVTVTPATCAANFATAPTGVALTTPAANRINVAWNAVPGAASYKIYRKTGDCAAATPYTAIGTAASTSFLDAIAIQGTQTYAYQVVATDNACASCTSPPSACAAIVATGACGSSPVFAGAASADNLAAASCGIRLSWNAGVPSCGSGALTYNIHRSTQSGFIPSAANRIASGVTGTSFTNGYGVQYNTAYHYIVRAVDSFGNEDGNRVQVSGMATGPLTGSGVFSETFEAPDGGPVNAGWTVDVVKAGAVNPWRASNLRKRGGSYSAFDPDSTANSDHAYDSPPLALSAGSALTFWHAFSFENQSDSATCATGFDGGIVEYRVCAATPCAGAWTALLATQITGATYTGTIQSTDNNLNGSPGFVCGTGAVPAFAQSAVNLGAIAGAGTVQVRWRQADDTGNTGNAPVGWFLDDVQVTSVSNLQTACTAAPCPAAAMSTLRHGKSGGDLAASWSGVSGAATYHVYRGASANPATFTSPLASLSGGRPGYTDAGQLGTTASQFYDVTFVNECLAESPK